ncbi:hypothetical protein WMF20_28125 [Sorangium sp. So ce834]|uniref:hypothetical protein n=1 Tax=Sorangium sp. So ce834 TaxID=3133321 RepID=UPI003F618C5A
MMKLVKALGALALSGVALGTTHLAAAETTTPIQDLVIVEETASPDLGEPRIAFAPYSAYRPYGLYGYRPYSAYGYRPYGLYGYRPYSAYGYRPYGVYGYRPYGGYGFRPYGVYGYRPYGGYGYRPYGYRPGFQPFGWHRPWRSLSSGGDAAPGGDIPTPAVSLPHAR